MKILLVEDDVVIARNVKTYLAREGINTTLSGTGEEGLYFFESEDFDVIILDRRLPDMDGLKICEKIREAGSKVPIIFLTARQETEDKVEGLNCGADDYLTKPFTLEELTARIKAAVRRKDSGNPSPTIIKGNLKIDTNQRLVYLEDRLINLSPREYSLLEFLANNNNVTVDRMQILEHVWGEETDMLSNTVDVHIAYLRKKMPKLVIKTIKEKGYMLCL